jgi:hypothetical protein
MMITDIKEGDHQAICAGTNGQDEKMEDRCFSFDIMLMSVNYLPPLYISECRVVCS